MKTVIAEKKAMDHLDLLEYQSVFILREAYREFKQLVMLWSIGKDSTVLLWLARKAFFGHVPLPLMHIDTGCKIPAMIDYRDKLAREWNLNMIVGKNVKALKESWRLLLSSGAKQIYPAHGKPFNADVLEKLL